MKPIQSSKFVVLSAVIFAGLVILAGSQLLSCAGTDEFSVVRMENDQSKQLAGREKKVDLTFVISGSTAGDFEPCGCGGVFDGGLSRRSFVIEKLRQSNTDTLLVDTGDITTGGSVTQTEFLAEAYHFLRYDAIALGEGDLRVGFDAFNKYVKQYELPVVASNVKFKIHVPVREVITIHRCNRKLAVISVISDRWLAILPDAIRNQIVYEQPVHAIRRLAAQLKSQGYDAVILLSHLGTSERKNVETGLDCVDLWIDNGGHQWVVEQIKNATGQSTQPVNIDINRYPPLLISWQNDRKIGIAGIKWKDGKITVPVMEMFHLVKSIPEDKRFIELYDAYKYAARQEMINRIMNPRIQTDSDAKVRPVEFPYVTSETCGACHPKIYEFWKSTGHSRAFGILEKNKRDADVNCWACHSTGYREPGGFIDPKSTPKFRDVGCQACHKVDLSNHHNEPAQSQYPAIAKMKAKRVSITQSWQCQRCHVPHRSPDFDYRKYLKRINCSNEKNSLSNPTTRPVKSSS